MSQPDKDTEQDNQGNVPTPQGVGEPKQLERVIAPERGTISERYVHDLENSYELLKQANRFLREQVEEKTDKLARLQIATYKCVTQKQYNLIQKEAENAKLNQGLEPPSHFYFPKIGVRRCQCDVCKALAQGIRQQISSDKTLEGYTDAALFQLTGIGHFEGHSGFNREEATYLCEFLNKHSEYMHKLENLDKDRYAE